MLDTQKNKNKKTNTLKYINCFQLKDCIYQNEIVIVKLDIYIH